MNEIKNLTLWDLFKIIFTDKERLSKVSDITLKRNYFMVNRTFAIKFPLQAAYFSLTGINEAEVVREWQNFIIQKNMFGRVPQWVYTKGSKKSSEKKESKKEFPNSLLIEYSLHYSIGMKDIKDALEFYHDDMVKELKRFETLMKAKNSIEKEKI